MKTIFAITLALSLGAIPATSVKAQLLNSQSKSTSTKTQTSDPYFSTPAQSAAEQNTKWSIPQKAPASGQTEIWKSLGRKTSKPVQRIDFSQLQVNPAVKADLLKTASAWQAPRTVGAEASSPIEKRKGAVTIDFSAPATSAPVTKPQPRQQLKATKQVAPSKPIAASKKKTISSLAPLQVAKTVPQRAVSPSIQKRNPLIPLPSSTPALQQPKRLATKPVAKPIKPLGSPVSEFESSVQQVTYQEPAGGSFAPGQNIKKLQSRIQQLNPQSNGSSSKQVVPDKGYRIADSSTAFDSNLNQSGSGTKIQSGSDTKIQSGSDTKIVDNTIYDSTVITGETFEPSRVVAIVGGDPIFVGDMLFEANQLIEKHMKGAPEAAKVHQRGNLIKRLLPKYIDQKILFISTTGGLPEGADLEDVISQAEKTFNDQALPEIMKRSGVTSTAQFDGNLRAQGSSIRQMRRAWAKDQVSRYLLAEKVNVRKDVTHQELIDTYRDNYDSYANIAKSRWEKIEIKFSKAGGRFAAKDKMDDIYQRLVHGGNFQAIAKKESHGFKASKGGQHDWTQKGSMVSKEVDKAIFTLPQGRLSEIIETKDSFLVVRVIERVDAYHTSFEEVQSDIKKKIIDERRDKEFKKYLKKIRKEIPVEYPEG